MAATGAEVPEYPDYDGAEEAMDLDAIERELSASPFVRRAEG